MFVTAKNLSQCSISSSLLEKQVFFRAGVLGQMEELRDERLGKIVSWMQAYIRGYLSRKDYKKLQEQRLALVVVQRNLRKYLQLRTWPWWKLWQKIKPLLNVTRIEDEMAVSISSRSRQQAILLKNILRIKIIIKIIKSIDFLFKFLKIFLHLLLFFYLTIY